MVIGVFWDARTRAGKFAWASVMEYVDVIPDKCSGQGVSFFLLTFCARRARCLAATRSWFLARRSSLGATESGFGDTALPNDCLCGLRWFGGSWGVLFRIPHFEFLIPASSAGKLPPLVISAKFADDHALFWILSRLRAFFYWPTSRVKRRAGKRKRETGKLKQEVRRYPNLRGP